MKRRDFTLVELVVTAVIILVLATFAAGGYRQLIDNSRSRVDQANLRTLSAAVEVYALENDSFPATLGQLRLKDLRRGYARVIKTAGWRTKLSYFLIHINTPLKCQYQGKKAAIITYKPYPLCAQLLNSDILDTIILY